jgi:hypothetical protein
MEQLAEKLKDVKIKVAEKHPLEKIEGSRWVSQATLQADLLWPGKLGANEMTMTTTKPQFGGKLRMIDVPKYQRLVLIWEDGSEYGVPSSNVKGMIYV